MKTVSKGTGFEPRGRPQNRGVRSVGFPATARRKSATVWRQNRSVQTPLSTSARRASSTFIRLKSASRFPSSSRKVAPVGVIESIRSSLKHRKSFANSHQAASSQTGPKTLMESGRMQFATPRSGAAPWLSSKIRRHFLIRTRSFNPWSGTANNAVVR